MLDQVIGCAGADDAGADDDDICDLLHGRFAPLALGAGCDRMLDATIEKVESVE